MRGHHLHLHNFKLLSDVGTSLWHIIAGRVLLGLELDHFSTKLFFSCAINYEINTGRQNTHACNWIGYSYKAGFIFIKTGC